MRRSGEGERRGTQGVRRSGEGERRGTHCLANVLEHSVQLNGRSKVWILRCLVLCSSFLKLCEGGMEKLRISTDSSLVQRSGDYRSPRRRGGAQEGEGSGE